MKLVKLFSLAIVMLVAVTSCNKVEKILPKQDGTWNVKTQVEREYENDSLVSTETSSNVATIVFVKDGTGTYTEKDSTNGDAFTWSVNDDGDVVTMCQSLGSISFCFDNTVVESSKDAQSWSVVDVDGTFRSETDIELERK